jgi:hypothetical protein
LKVKGWSVSVGGFSFEASEVGGKKNNKKKKKSQTTHIFAPLN